MWLGSIETSDEHIVGTELGVIKARAVASVSGDKRFDGKAIEDMKGTPWKPSTKHKGTKIRTHLSEEEEEDDNEDEDDINEEQDEAYLDEDPPEVIEKITKQQEIIYNRIGLSYSFTIKARDVAKYGATPGCPGCRFVARELTVQ